jgi:hypothetical protein
MPVTKLQAAQRQLDCAIQLFFGEEDLLSTITLAHASFRVLHDIYPVHKSDGFENHMERLISSIGWKRFNAAANFLKHADTDAGATIEASPIDAMIAIGFATILHSRIAGYSPEMRGFNSFMGVMEPEVFAGPPDPEHHAFDDFQRAVDSMKSASHADRMALGRKLVETCRAMERGLWTQRPPTEAA